MKIEPAGICNIVFDLGNVLLNLDFDASIRAFHDLGFPKEVLDRKQVYSDAVFYQLETGKVSASGFRKRVRELLKNPAVTDVQIDAAWSAMILDIPPARVEMLQKLNKKFKVYLFSNTNEIHIAKLHHEFRESYGIEFSSLFVKDFYSHEIQERKPDLISFQKVIKLAGINPSETLFIDDLEMNVKAAAQLGLKTLLHNPAHEIADFF